MNGQCKTPEKQANEVEIGSLPEKSVEWPSFHTWFNYFHKKTGIGEK